MVDFCFHLGDTVYMETTKKTKQTAANNKYLRALSKWAAPRIYKRFVCLVNHRDEAAVKEAQDRYFGANIGLDPADAFPKAR